MAQDFFAILDDCTPQLRRISISRRSDKVLRRSINFVDIHPYPFTLSTGNYVNSLITPYIGIDVKTSHNDKYQFFLEGNLNFGLSSRVGLWKAITDIYIQGGSSYDFSQRINDKVYGYGQFGMRFYLR